MNLFSWKRGSDSESSGKRRHIVIFVAALASKSNLNSQTTTITWKKQNRVRTRIYLRLSLYTMSIELALNASTKVEPFLLMAKSARGAAAAKLIQDATSAPGVFVFSELLDIPSIQEVRSVQLRSYRVIKSYLPGTTAIERRTLSLFGAATTLCL